MLVWGLTLNMGFLLISVVVYAIFGPFLQFLRASILLILGFLLLAGVVKKPIWRPASHCISVVLVLVIWSNVLIYVRGANIATIQFVFLTVVYSFYLHGIRWGLFYSITATLPVILHTVFSDKTFYVFTNSPQAVNKPIYVFVIIYNFLLILFLHYHFFGTFIKNIKELVKAGKEQKILNDRLRKTMLNLERTSKAKTDFLSTMSHELRTPLNGVIGLSNVLLMQDPREDQKENLGILKFSAESLLALINDILDFNKLEAGKLLLENTPVDLAELLQNICGGMRLRAQDKSIALNLRIDHQLNEKLIICDPLRLTQVLLNLLNNAVKFTEQGSVEVSADVISMDEKNITIRFQVKDTGIGISKNKQLSIFDPFTQASINTTRKFGGTGLGLAIVKRILEVYNSTIDVESEPGKGTLFLFDINFQYLIQDKVVLSKKVSTDHLSDLHVKVLVAEDNPVNVLVIEKLLAIRGVTPVVVGNGLAVVRALQEDNFDVILMDLYMPDMDGFTAAKAVRAMEDEEKSQIPIIALTASVSEDVKMKVRESGMNDYLSKPFNPHVLFEKIEKLLQKKELFS